MLDILHYLRYSSCTRRFGSISTAVFRLFVVIVLKLPPLLLVITIGVKAGPVKYHSSALITGPPVGLEMALVMTLLMLHVKFSHSVVEAAK
jgi:hypothetical protein